MYARYNSTTSITPAPQNYSDGNVTVVNLPSNPEMCAELGFYPCTDPAPQEGYEVDWDNSTFELTEQSEQRTRTVTSWSNGAWRTRTETYTEDTSYITPTWAYKAVEVVLPTYCTRYELIKLMQATNPEWLEYLRTQLKKDAELEFLWNSVNDLDLKDENMKRMLVKVGISEEMIQQIQNGMIQMRNVEQAGAAETTASVDTTEQSVDDIVDETMKETDN